MCPSAVAFIAVLGLSRPLGTDLDSAESRVAPRLRIVLMRQR